MSDTSSEKTTEKKVEETTTIEPPVLTDPKEEHRVPNLSDGIVEEKKVTTEVTKEKTED